MRILLPTGVLTEDTVKKAAAGHDAVVVVTGEIASFLSPVQLARLVQENPCDCVIVSGMCTADFCDVEKATGIPVFLGPRHAADLAPVMGTVAGGCLSRTVPADELFRSMKEHQARESLLKTEQDAQPVLIIRGVAIGGGSRMKVLAEIMDAHRHPDIRRGVLDLLTHGADVVDLGFGFDATPDDVLRVFRAISDISAPLAVDTQDPDLMRAALPRADLFLSLQEENIPCIAGEIAMHGRAAVVVPGNRGLAANLMDSEEAGVTCLIADPLLMPAGSGLVASLSHGLIRDYPVFFGAGNVTELIDADSPGVNALLAAIAHEMGCSVIFTSEHSDKTRGSVAEMRRATEMMALTRDRPYPKDLGIDLLVIKEKRRREEPPLVYHQVMEGTPPPERLVLDPRGNYRIGIENGNIVAECHGVAIRGRTWEEVFQGILGLRGVSLLEHAAYLGKELYKAELALRFGRSFEQDGPF